MFCLDEQVAINGFEAHIGGKRIVGVLKSKLAAQEIYDDAIASGAGAYLLEQLSNLIYKSFFLFFVFFFFFFFC
jgi:hypothetical protein